MQNFFRDYMPYPYVYLQYSSEDAERVIPIIKELKHKKFNIYFDKEFHIEDKERVIDAETIASSTMLLIFYSKAASKSRLIKETVKLTSHILNLNKMCVCLDDTKFGLSFGDLKKHYKIVLASQTDNLTEELERQLELYRLPDDVSEGSDELVEDTEEADFNYPEAFDESFNEPESFEDDFVFDEYEAKTPDLLVLAKKQEDMPLVVTVSEDASLSPDIPLLTEESPQETPLSEEDASEAPLSPDWPLLTEEPEEVPQEMPPSEENFSEENAAEVPLSPDWPLLTEEPEEVPQEQTDAMYSDNGYLPLGQPVITTLSHDAAPIEDFVPHTVPLPQTSEKPSTSESDSFSSEAAIALCRNMKPASKCRIIREITCFRSSSPSAS